jgi:uncharacterized protein (DUF2267 family)
LADYYLGAEDVDPGGWWNRALEMFRERRRAREADKIMAELTVKAIFLGRVPPNTGGDTLREDRRRALERLLSKAELSRSHTEQRSRGGEVPDWDVAVDGI